MRLKDQRNGAAVRLKDLIESLEALHALFGDVPVKFAAGPRNLVVVSTYISDDEKVAWVDLIEAER